MRGLNCGVSRFLRNGFHRALRLRGPLADALAALRIAAAPLSPAAAQSATTDVSNLDNSTGEEIAIPEIAIPRLILARDVQSFTAGSNYEGYEFVSLDLQMSDRSDGQNYVARLYKLGTDSDPLDGLPISLTNPSSSASEGYSPSRYRIQ